MLIFRGLYVGLRKEKIQGTYFKICALYFKICPTYFLQRVEEATKNRMYNFSVSIGYAR